MRVQASVLDLFKELPIAITSFVIASFLPRIGYKKAMLSRFRVIYSGMCLHVLWKLFLVG